MQLNLQQTFARNTPLQKDSVKAKSITCAIGMMVAVDLRLYSIVENEGFRELLEPRYSMNKLLQKQSKYGNKLIVIHCFYGLRGFPAHCVRP